MKAIGSEDLNIQSVCLSLSLSLSANVENAAKCLSAKAGFVGAGATTTVAAAAAAAALVALRRSLQFAET